MQAFAGNQPHLDISARLDHHRDEATFVDWAQANPGPPDRQTSWRHLTADGKAADSPDDDKSRMLITGPAHKAPEHAQNITICTEK